MSGDEVERIASDITKDLVQILNKRFDIPYLSEDDEERLLLNVIHVVEQLVVDKGTSVLCKWFILFLLNFGVIALGKACNII